MLSTRHSNKFSKRGDSTHLEQNGVFVLGEVEVDDISSKFEIKDATVKTF